MSQMSKKQKQTQSDAALFLLCQSGSWCLPGASLPRLQFSSIQPVSNSLVLEPKVFVVSYTVCCNAGTVNVLASLPTGGGSHKAAAPFLLLAELLDPGSHSSATTCSLTSNILVFKVFISIHLQTILFLLKTELIYFKDKVLNLFSDKLLLGFITSHPFHKM